jgi:hypothetical protein
MDIENVMECEAISIPLQEILVRTLALLATKSHANLMRSEIDH